MGTMKTSRFAVQGGGDRRCQKGPEKEARGGTKAVPPRAWRNRFSGSCGGASSGADRIFSGRHFSGKSDPQGNRGSEQICSPGGVSKRIAKMSPKNDFGERPTQRPRGHRKIDFLASWERDVGHRNSFFSGGTFERLGAESEHPWKP